MNNWNRTGKIKAIALGLLALPNLFLPIGPDGEFGLGTILVPLIFASISIPLIVKFNGAVLGKEIVKPTWNDNPLTLKRSLAMFDFFSYFFVVIGLSMIIGTGVKFYALSNFGLTAIAFGLGIFIGIQLTLKRTRN